MPYLYYVLFSVCIRFGSTALLHDTTTSAVSCGCIDQPVPSWTKTSPSRSLAGLLPCLPALLWSVCMSMASSDGALVGCRRPLHLTGRRVSRMAPRPRVVERERRGGESLAAADENTRRETTGVLRCLVHVSVRGSFVEKVVGRSGGRWMSRSQGGGPGCGQAGTQVVVVLPVKPKKVASRESSA